MYGKNIIYPSDNNRIARNSNDIKNTLNVNKQVKTDNQINPYNINRQNNNYDDKNYKGSIDKRYLVDSNTTNLSSLSEKSIHLFNTNNTNNTNSYNNQSSNYRNNYQDNNNKQNTQNNRSDSFKYFNEDEEFFEQTFQRELLEEINNMKINKKKISSLDDLNNDSYSISKNNNLSDIWDTKVGFYNEGLSCYV